MLRCALAALREVLLTHGSAVELLTRADADAGVEASGGRALAASLAPLAELNAARVFVSGLQQPFAVQVRGEGLSFWKTLSIFEIGFHVFV